MLLDGEPVQRFPQRFDSVPPLVVASCGGTTLSSAATYPKRQALVAQALPTGSEEVVCRIDDGPHGVAGATVLVRIGESAPESRPGGRRRQLPAAADHGGGVRGAPRATDQAGNPASTEFIVIRKGLQVLSVQLGGREPDAEDGLRAGRRGRRAHHDRRSPGLRHGVREAPRRPGRRAGDRSSSSASTTRRSSGPRSSGSSRRARPAWCERSASSSARTRWRRARIRATLQRRLRPRAAHDLGHRRRDDRGDRRQASRRPGSRRFASSICDNVGLAEGSPERFVRGRARTAPRRTWRSCPRSPPANQPTCGPSEISFLIAAPPGPPRREPLRVHDRSARPRRPRRVAASSRSRSRRRTSLGVDRRSASCVALRRVRGAAARAQERDRCR